MKCNNCGADNEPDSAFCISCGAQTAPSAEDSAPASAAQPDNTAVPSVARQDATTEQVNVVPQREDALLVATRGALADDYEIQSELGRGGMAVVFEGVESELRRRVAVKVLPPEMATEDTAERFKREARMAASLDHPNIIPVYRVGQAEGIQYMAMKFVDGRGLDEIVKEQGALPVPVAARIIADSARALAFAHDNGVIHRDIKGANILLEKDGRVLVTDFGIARAVGDHTITKTGMVMGTPSYMSPEQCGGVKLSHQSDQYSLGVLAFQLLTGSLPFSAETFVGLVQHHYMTPPPDIKRVRQDVPDEFLAVVYRALAKKPEERFPNTKQMVAALDAVPFTAEERTEADRILQQLVTGHEVEKVEIDDLPPLVTPMETALAAAPPPAKSRAPMIVASAAAVVVVASVGVAWQAGLFGSQAPVEPPPDSVQVVENHILTISDWPEGASCTVGGIRLGGCQGAVPPGQHVLVVTADGYTSLHDSSFQMPREDWGYSVGDRMERLERNDPRPVPPTVATGQLMVRATPTFATIRLDGEEINNGATIEIPAGRHTLRVTANGYEMHEQEIDVPVSDILRLPIILTESGGQP